MGLIIPLFISHQGCPHRCLFCNQHAISGSKPGQSIRGVDVERIVSSWLEKLHGGTAIEVAFYGGSFTCLDSDLQYELLSAVQPFIDQDRVKAIRLSTRPDCISSERINTLLEFGVTTVELGVQSLDDTVLESAMRGHSSADSLMAMSLLKERGLQVGVQLLPGLPGETTSSFFSTVREVISQQPDLVRIYPAVVVRNSSLAAMFGAGDYSPLSLNKAIALATRAWQMFRGAGIRVVRIGLQPSTELESELVAGPYHPSFGELVRSRDWFLTIRRRLAGLKGDEHLQIHVSHRDLSAVVGMKRANVIRFDQLGFTNRYTIIPEKNRERDTIGYVVS